MNRICIQEAPCFSGELWVPIMEIFSPNEKQFSPKLTGENMVFIGEDCFCFTR